MIAAVLGIVLTVTACSANSSDPDYFATFGLGVEDAPPVPGLDAGRVAAGQSDYSQNCAICHQPDLSGANDWKIRDEDGFLKPPPLNSDGHAWHHPDSLLADIVTDGSSDPGSRMKGFSGRLSAAEIADVIEFLKSTWGPDERSFQWFTTWQETQP